MISLTIDEQKFSIVVDNYLRTLKSFTVCLLTHCFTHLLQSSQSHQQSIYFTQFVLSDLIFNHDEKLAVWNGRCLNMVPIDLRRPHIGLSACLSASFLL
jgi:hypothetical protein